MVSRTVSLSERRVSCRGDAEPLAELLRVCVPGAAEDADLAGSGFEQAFENFDGGGFAGAVGAEQAEAFAFVDLQIEAAQGFDFGVVGLAQAAALDGDAHADRL